MAFKQPRVPEYLEQDGAVRCLRNIILFLKDFCLEAWQAVRMQGKRMDEMERCIREPGMEEREEYVRYDQQSLTDAQQEQARANIGAASAEALAALGLSVVDGKICQTYKEA